MKIIDKNEITKKYEQQEHGNVPIQMTYFTLEDVHKAMDEYLQLYIEGNAKGIKE